MKDEVLFFFDLEVVPREATAEELAKLGAGTAPANYKDPAKIKAYEDAKAEKLYRDWAFDSLNCEIVCCSYSIGLLKRHKDGTVEFDAGMVRTLRSDKDDIIADLDRIAAGFLHAEIGRQGRPPRRVRVIAHNVAGYDKPVLMAQAVKTQSLSLMTLLYSEKKWESRLFDTCEWWRNHASTGGKRSSAKLDAIAKFLGVGAKTEGFDGSKVFDAYKAGLMDEICDYCEQDVRVLSAVYERLLPVL